MTKSVDVYLCKSKVSAMQPRGVYEWHDDGISYIGTYQGYIDYWSKKEKIEVAAKMEDKETFMQKALSRFK